MEIIAFQQFVDSIQEITVSIVSFMNKYHRIGRILPKISDFPELLGRILLSAAYFSMVAEAYWGAFLSKSGVHYLIYGAI